MGWILFDLIAGTIWDGVAFEAHREYGRVAGRLVAILPIVLLVALIAFFVILNRFF
jgi:hypothetical protein